MDDFAHSPQENKSIVNETSFIELFVALSGLCCVSIGIFFQNGKKLAMDINRKGVIILLHVPDQ